MESWRAVFRDRQGRTYSCPVVNNDGAWGMLTSDGPAPITLNFDDDVAGRLTFDSYREVEDSRLHLEAKQPGQSSLAQLQTAAAKAEAQARRDRLEGRQQVLAATNQPDARQAQEVRRIQNEIAQQKRPRGSGQYIVKGE